MSESLLVDVQEVIDCFEIVVDRVAEEHWDYSRAEVILLRHVLRFPSSPEAKELWEEYRDWKGEFR